MTRARDTTHRGELIKFPIEKHKLRRTSAALESKTSGLFHAQAFGYKYVSTTTHYTRLGEEALQKIAIDVTRHNQQAEGD